MTRKVMRHANGRGEKAALSYRHVVTMAGSSRREKHTAVGEHEMRRFDLLKKMVPELRLEEWVEGQEGKREGRTFQKEACAQPCAGRERGKHEACEEGYSIRSSGSKVSRVEHLKRGGWKRPARSLARHLKKCQPSPETMGSHGMIWRWVRQKG